MRKFVYSVDLQFDLFRCKIDSEEMTNVFYVGPITLYFNGEDKPKGIDFELGVTEKNKFIKFGDFGPNTFSVKSVPVQLELGNFGEKLKFNFVGEIIVDAFNDVDDKIKYLISGCCQGDIEMIYEK